MAISLLSSAVNVTDWKAPWAPFRDLARPCKTPAIPMRAVFGRSTEAGRHPRSITCERLGYITSASRRKGVEELCAGAVVDAPKRAEHTPYASIGRPIPNAGGFYL